MDLLMPAFLFSVIVNLLMFIPAFTYKTDKLTDISYALTFMGVATFSVLKSTQSIEHLILWTLVMLWASRLGIFLFVRINRMGKDKRFDGMRESFFKFIRFWLLQGVSVFVVLVSSVLLWQEQTPQLTILSFLGAFIFLIGLSLEATADYQKFVFTGKAQNKGKWIETGVWSISRHPNYLGEMLVWVGLYTFAVQSLGGNDKLIALVSPLYIILLLLFVSGIPLLEKSADKRWGSDKSYQAYKKRVPVLLPKLKG